MLGLKHEKKLIPVAATSTTIDIEPGAVKRTLKDSEVLECLEEATTELLYGLKFNHEKHETDIKEMLAKGEDQSQADILMMLRDKIKSTKVALQSITKVEIPDTTSKYVIIRYDEPK